MRNKALIVSVTVFSAYLTTAAQTILQITDFNCKAGGRNNCVPAVQAALATCNDNDSTIIMFPKGRYDFWPSSENQGFEVGFDLKEKKNVIIEGNGSEFIFHGNMQIAMLDECEQVTLRNFSVDWERPYISQAEILHVTDGYIDMKIDSEKYPYVIEKGKILFVGEGWKLPVILTYNNLFDQVTKEIVSQSWDAPLGDTFEQEAEYLGNDIVRFYGGKRQVTPSPGNIVTLFHARYMTNGIHIRKSKNTVLQNLVIYHALSHGVLGEMSENITMDNTSMTVNEAKGRVFSIVADASHFLNCKGVIKVENCAHTGMGDDFINVHGRNVIVQKVEDRHTIVTNIKGYCNQIGDEMWLLRQNKAQREEIYIIEAITPVYQDQKLIGYRISFKTDLPEDIKPGDFFENKTWTASLELRGCHILKRHRARGILVTTPQKVVIENNYFRTAGTAILIEGDIDHWFESGANTNVQIRNNVFEDCLTSGNRDGDRWQWGDAVITITPSHKPTSEKTEPYHQNIWIYNNTFKVFDAPLLRARSVRGLRFTNNEVLKTTSYQPYLWQKSAFLFDGCRDVLIWDNHLDVNYITRDVLIEHMKRSDIKTKGFKVISVKGMKTYLN